MRAALLPLFRSGRVVRPGPGVRNPWLSSSVGVAARLSGPSAQQGKCRRPRSWVLGARIAAEQQAFDFQLLRPRVASQP